MKLKVLMQNLWGGVNEMKKDEAPGCHEMVNVVGEIDASWIKRLLNIICMNSCEVVEE